MRADAIRTWLVAEIAGVVGIAPSAIDVRAPFDSLGLSSVDGVTLSGELEQLLGCELPPTLVYEHPSIEALAAHLGESADADSPSPTPRRALRSEPIAIVGIGCRFPGADDPESFWRLLRDGRDMIREVPPVRWDAAAYYDPDPTAPGKSASRWGGFLDQIDQFDPFFFGISPGEAERMDPQQRLLMELAYEAFEDAGYPMSRLAGSRTAVVVGISVNEYGLLQHGRHELLNGHSGTGAALAIAANRISYFFDLHGPSLAVDTACSSSLMAVHLACQSLASGECDVALAGGVNLIVSPAHSIAFTKAGVLAPDGRCKPFDAAADGYVRGEGGGLVVLKPLASALAVGDSIYAVIRGGAVFQDGRTNGLMAPNREAQEAVLRAAYANAGVSPGDVQYLETHGTGTLLGDSMEANAIGRVASVRRREAPLALGSVKSNLGHLEAAAGAAGLIKVALALKHGSIPPTLHFTSPNPYVPFEALGLRVQRELAKWPICEGPRLAGVSSFGFGGTNVHLVLEEAPHTAIPPTAEDGAPHLLALSAHSREALAAVARRFRDLVAGSASEAGPGLAELAANATLRRTHLDQRLGVIAGSKAELLERLDLFLRGESHPEIVVSGETETGRRRLAFVFSGQGSQWHGMGSELFRCEPVFRSILEACDAALQPELGWSLIDRVFGGEGGAALETIDVIQPALFGIQVALAALWRSWGVEPDAVVGHSMGEVAAAHVSGGLTLAAAARVIAVRSRLLRGLSGQGAMALIALPAEVTATHLSARGGALAIAASNGPRSTVVAGEAASLDALLTRLEEQGVFCRRIKVDVAAHGPQAAPLAGELRRALQGIVPQPGSIPFLSSVTGSVLDTGQLGPEYWARNLTEPVNFAGAIQELVHDEGWDVVEISPHPLLQSSVLQGMQQLGRDGSSLVSLRRGEGERAALFQSLAALYVAGRPIIWDRIHPPGAVVSLPAYPWQRQRFWLEAAGGDDRVTVAGIGARAAGEHPLLGHPIPLAREPQTWLWQCSLDPCVENFLADHRVKGELVVPGSAFLEMALAAAAQAGLTSHALEHVEFLHSLVLGSDAPRTLQVVLTPSEGETYSFAAYSALDRQQPAEWTQHATANLVPMAPPAAQVDGASQLERARTRCVEPMAPEELYRALSSRGLAYGPAMRAITEVWRGEGEALAQVVLPKSPVRDDGRYRIHPVLLDGALQCLGAARGLLAGDPDATFLPAGCDAVRLPRKPGARLWSHVVVRAGSAAEDGLEADLVLFDDEGHVVAEIDRLRLARVRRRARPDTAPAEQDAWLYQVHWQSVARPDKPHVPPSSISAVGQWVILADQGGVAEELAGRLAEGGEHSTLIRLDQARSESDIPGEQDEAIADLIAAGLGAERSAVRGVVGIWCGEPAPAAARTLGCNAVLAAVRRLLGASAAIGSARLWLVTRGTQPVVPGERVAAAHAPIWGLGKSIAFELPQLQCTLVDLDPAQDAASASEALAKELLHADEEDQVALRGERRLVARLRPHCSSAGPGACATASRPAKIREDGSYLITGGLGGLGRTVARWLIDQGARRLVVVGRKPPSPPAARWLDGLRGQGADVAFVPADVSQADEVNRLLGRMRETMPPVRGIVHAAGVLENGPVVSLDAGSLARVMAPKVEGAWNLHMATLHDDLDFFVLFSSAVSVLGSPGQGNYSAANSFLDALAHRRRAEGRPATSINWGPWAEVGLVAEDNFIGRQPGRGDRGIKGIDPIRGLELLGRALAEDMAQVTILPFDLRSLLDLYPQAARIPLFADVGGSESHLARLYARPRLRQEYVAPRTDIERRMAEMWRQTLRIDRVGIHDSFFELGGDSVLAAQLVASAHRAFGVDLDLRDAFKAFTIESLAARIEAALVARLDQMSEGEVQRLLQER